MRHLFKNTNMMLFQILCLVLSLYFLSGLIISKQKCEDSIFKNRSRPCLQYQIGRCSGPCVELVSPADYSESVRHTEMFLGGRSDTLSSELADRMEGASEKLEFERRQPSKNVCGRARVSGVCRSFLSQRSSADYGRRRP